MRSFAALFISIDESTSTNSKVAAMAQYFVRAAPADAAIAVYFLAGGKPRRIIASKELRTAANTAIGLADWLFEECYQAVGDLAETIALLLPPATSISSLGLSQWLNDRLLALATMDSASAIERIQKYWSELSVNERLVLNKLLTGGFRLGVSKLLVIRALAQAFSIDGKVIAQRMIGYTDGRQLPSTARYAELIAVISNDISSNGARNSSDASRTSADGAGITAGTDYSGHPYPFFLAQSLQSDPHTALGERSDWLAEWKWDGIRVQLVKRAGRVWLWSRGEELITERFPELEAAAAPLSDGNVIDGELLAWDFAMARPLPFAILQKRIARKALSPKFLREHPVALVAYDLLEAQGRDIRARPQTERRAALSSLITACFEPAALAPIQLSPLIEAADWTALAQLRDHSRERGVEGFMLKRTDAAYGSGRVKADARGQWWKWKVDPYSIDCVLIYAQRGHGRRASLYTDYTFAVWDQDVVKEAAEPRPRKLVPFAKAYSGLTDQEIGRVDALIRKTVIEKFGPVRSVTPTLVFELGFEGLSLSTRHKSGVAVRFPRILRWREDKTIEQANTLADLKRLAGIA